MSRRFQKDRASTAASSALAACDVGRPEGTMMFPKASLRPEFETSPWQPVASNTAAIVRTYKIHKATAE